MKTFDDQLRERLVDLSDEVRPVPLLDRLDREAPPAIRRRRLAVAVVAAAAALVLAVTGSLVLERIEQPRIIEPLLRPPEVLRLSDVATTSPGRVQLAVVFSKAPDDEHTPVYVLPAVGGDAVLVPWSARVQSAWTQQLSVDGSHLVRQSDDHGDPLLELVNLVTGRSDDLGGTLGYCPVLSPDNTTVLVHNIEDDGMLLVDVATGNTGPLPGATERLEVDCGYNSGSWSPDGKRLAVRTNEGLVFTDPDGPVALRLPGKWLVNSSMSWSPDGASILVYDRATGDYSAVDPDTGEGDVIARPPDAVRPLGWAGSRVVWLVGGAGDQRLVSTDRRGGDPQTWMRLDVGERPVETVQWTAELGGTISD